MLTINGSHGSLTADHQSGTVVAYGPETSTEYANITRINVAEFQKHYSHESCDGMNIDILDVGYWYRSGDTEGYEPPVEEFREMRTTASAPQKPTKVYTSPDELVSLDKESGVRTVATP